MKGIETLTKDESRTKTIYPLKRILVKPIDEPKEIDLSKHLVFFVNEDNDQIEVAIPDFAERCIDSNSSNVSRIKRGTPLTYFERVAKDNISSDSPVFLVTVFEGSYDDESKYDGIKVVSSECINGFYINIEDVLFDKIKEQDKVKRR